MCFVMAMKHLHLAHPLKDVCALCDLSKYVFGQEYFRHHPRYEICLLILQSYFLKLPKRRIKLQFSELNHLKYQ